MYVQYEHNQVFAGRNWNNGEVVGENPPVPTPPSNSNAAHAHTELVLRGAGGGFLPTSWLLSTPCHEVGMT